MRAVTEELPLGVVRRRLAMHPDERGVFVEVFRTAWGVGVEPVQWNAVRSRAGVLRGVHVHVRHDDYLVVLAGRAWIGLRDLRARSPTEGRTALVELLADDMAALVLPHGVAHGFFFPEPSLHAYAVSHYWDPADELGCRWDDPALGIAWPTDSARLSARDAALPSLGELLAQLAPFQPLGRPA